MKKLGIVVIVILAVLLILVSAKNIIAKKAISAGVKNMTGLDLTIGSMNVGLFKSVIDIKQLQLNNPKGFNDKVMVDMPEIYADYDLGAFFKKSCAAPVTPRAVNSRSRRKKRAKRRNSK